MSLNIRNCKLLQITNKTAEDCDEDYYVDGIEMECVKHHPYLGVELTTNMSWEQHINNISSKATKTLNMLRRNLHKAPQEIKKQAYIAAVRTNPRIRVVKLGSTC